MYKFFTANTKTEKKLKDYISQRKNIKDKLDLLKENPRKANGAHPLHGRLKGKWTCWLGSDIRLIYSIKETDKIIIVEAIGGHKIYD